MISRYVVVVQRTLGNYRRL